MALNENIILSGQTTGQGSALAGGFTQGLKVRSMLDQMNQERELKPIRKSILESQAQQSQQTVAAGDQAAMDAERQREAISMATGAMEVLPFLTGKNIDIQGAVDAVDRRSQMLIERGATDLSDTVAVADALESGDPQRIHQVTKQMQSIVDIAERTGELKTGGKFSAATTWLPGGISVQTSTAGDKVVKGADGNVISGQAAVDYISAAQAKEDQRKVDVARNKERGKLEEQAELGGKAAGVKKAAEQAIKVSGEAFERLGGVKENIINIDKAISAIDQGADTGFIADIFPSMTSASIKLDTIQKQLGLDVISGATFGALSEGERAFAVSSALPSTLNEGELRKWLVNKRVAQNKMIKQLTEAATYLGTPGNTIVGYIEQVNAENNQPTATIPDVSPEAASLLDF